MLSTLQPGISSEPILFRSFAIRPLAKDLPLTSAQERNDRQTRQTRSFVKMNRQDAAQPKI